MKSRFGLGLMIYINLEKEESIPLEACLIFLWVKMMECKMDDLPSWDENVSLQCRRKSPSGNLTLR